MAKKSGPELDALVAEKVMGWRRCRESSEGEGLTRPWVTVETFGVCLRRPTKPGCSESWSPSADIAAAWEVVERILAIEKAKKTYLPVFSVQAAPDGCSAVLQVGMGCQIVVENARTAPLAICLAALKAVSVPTEE